MGIRGDGVDAEAGAEADADVDIDAEDNVSGSV